MVECLLSMQEVLGSIPRFSNTFLYCSECRLNSKVYYQWPLSLSDATFFGVSVNVGKKNFGKQLAHNSPIFPHQNFPVYGIFIIISLM